MATSTIDGTIEEAVIRRRRAKGGFYDRIKFRLDDGSTRTWTKLHVMNNVGDLLLPGTRGRFYGYRAMDHRGLSGVRTDDGKEAFGFNRINEYAGLGIAIVNILLTILYHSVLEDVSDFARIIAAVLAVAGIPMFILYRQTRLEAENAYNSDAG